MIEAERVATEEKPEITYAQYKKLMGQFFTVRHDIVEACGHKFVAGSTPKHANCEACWWAFFQLNGEATKQLDEFYRTEGKDWLIARHGKKFVTMFVRFMSTIVRLKKELEEANEQIRISGSSGENTEQAVQQHSDPSTLGGQSGSQSTIVSNPDSEQ